MSTGMSEEELYQLARERVEQKKGFYVHFAVFIGVNIMLVIIWAVTGADFPWFIFPLGGWGIAILFHFLGVFVWPMRVDKAAVEKEAEKRRREQR